MKDLLSQNFALSFIISRNISSASIRTFPLRHYYAIKVLSIYIIQHYKYDSHMHAIVNYLEKVTSVFPSSMKKSTCDFLSEWLARSSISINLSPLHLHKKKPSIYIHTRLLLLASSLRHYRPGFYTPLHIRRGQYCTTIQCTSDDDDGHGHHHHRQWSHWPSREAESMAVTCSNETRVRNPLLLQLHFSLHSANLLLHNFMSTQPTYCSAEEFNLYTFQLYTLFLYSD